MAKNLITQTLLYLALTTTSVVAQTENLLKNPNADEGTERWRAFGEAKVDETGDAGRSFVLRDGGYFIQDVALPDGAAEQYAVLIARASSERVNPDGAITGLPSLYGYMMNASGGHINAYLQGQHMLSSAKVAGEWVQLWGIFRVPVGTATVNFFLKQAEGQGLPHNNSAARFKDLGLYLFPTQDEARAFVGPAAIAEPGRTPDASPARTPPCTLTLAQAPAIHGIQLGMDIEQVLNFFPGGGDDPNVRQALEKSRQANNFGFVQLAIDPNKYVSDSKYADVKRFVLRFLDNRMFGLHVEFNKSKWNNVDEFISKFNGHLSLPQPDAWHSVDGISAKYLACDGFDIRFYAAPKRSNNAHYVEIIDNSAGKALTVRRAAKEKAR